MSYVAPLMKLAITRCLFQEAAHEKSHKYKEGKYVLERY